MKKQKRKKIIGAAFVFTIVLVLAIFVYERAQHNSLRESLVEVEGRQGLDLRTINHSVESGEHLDVIFEKAGVSADQAHEVIKVFGKYWDVRNCQIGDKIDFSFDNRGTLIKFRYQASLANVYEVILMRDGYQVFKLGIPVETKAVRLQVDVEHSLYQDFIDAGERPELVERIVDMLAWDVDFFSDQKKGDIVSLIVEKQFVEGEFYKYGRIRALGYNGEEINQTAFYYDGNKEVSGYYDLSGKSLARNFLKTPLKYTRISSGFGMRRHPISHRLKQHLGTDYAAPKGTPVWAMAEGVVVKKGYSGCNGNFVAIKHRKDLTTSYLHLSRFEPGLKVGSRVNQKEIIGYVGSTGCSTGPHLHLAVVQGKKNIDPLTLKKVKEVELAGKDLERFEQLKFVMTARLNNEEIKFAWFPPGVILAGSD